MKKSFILLCCLCLIFFSCKKKGNPEILMSEASLDTIELRIAGVGDRDILVEPARTFNYEGEEGEYYVFNGDILIEKKDTLNKGLGAGGHYWPSNQITYRIASNVDGALLQKVRDAIAHYHEHTILQFVEDPTARKQAILFIRGNDGCFAELGYDADGFTGVEITDACRLGNVIHEIGHALGFMHEQLRPDRDEYIIVNRDNINPKYISQFYFDSDITREPHGTYDFGSIMHYPKRGFPRSSSSGNTIEVRSEFAGTRIGQRDSLSIGDRSMINAIYENGIPSPENPEVLMVNSELVFKRALQAPISERFDLSGMSISGSDLFVVSDRRNKVYKWELDANRINSYKRKLIRNSDAEFEAIAQCGETFYVANEKGRHACVLAGNRIDKLDFKFEDSNLEENQWGQSGLKGMAVDCENNICYVLKGGSPRRIFETRLVSGSVLSDFNIETDDAFSEFSDATLDFSVGNYLYVLVVGECAIYKVSLETKRVMSKVSYCETIGLNAEGLFGDGVDPSQALTMTESELYIGFDNNGRALSAFGSDQSGFETGSAKPLVFVFERPNGF